MIRKIVDIIKSNPYQIEDRVIIINNYKVIDKSCLEYLQEKNCFENYIDVQSIKNNDIINFELIVSTLNSIGFYESTNAFLIRNRYILLKDDYYILDIDSFNNSHNDFITSYNLAISFINAIKEISKHNFSDPDYEYSIVSKEGISIVIPYKYDVNDIVFTIEQQKSICEFTHTLNESNEKQQLYINEFIEYASKVNEMSRFSFVLNNIIELSENSYSAYNFFLSDFSSNKLKLEISTKLLDFSQKTRTIINEAQTKLIAIPVASVFAISSLVFTDLYSPKNFAVILSLWIFAILMHLFINNQKDGLQFISNNINNYKNKLPEIKLPEIVEEFSKLHTELHKQEMRIYIIYVINLFIPISITVIWGIMLIIKNLATIMLFTQFLKTLFES